MACDQCCEARKINGQIHEDLSTGCFPNLYGAIEGVGEIDQAISLYIAIAVSDLSAQEKQVRWRKSL